MISSSSSTAVSGASSVRSRAAILLDQFENALDATHFEFSLASMYALVGPVVFPVAQVGKETDPKGDQGVDFSLLTFEPAHFDEFGKMAKASPALVERFATASIKAITRKAGVDRNTIRKILRGDSKCGVPGSSINKRPKRKS